MRSRSGRIASPGSRRTFRSFPGAGMKSSVRVALAVVCGVSAVAGGAEAPAAKSLRFTKKQLMVAPNENCTVADIDKDGVLDIVYGPYWLAGPDFVPRALRPNHVAKEYMRANSDHAYDVDKDGWLDVIA